MAEFALVGSREIVRLQKEKKIPPRAIGYFKRAAQRIAEGGHLLRSGGAPGADQLALQVACAHQGAVEIFLPHAKFEKPWLQKLPVEQIHVTIFDPRLYPEAGASVQKFHPAPASILKSPAANFIQQAHARNAMIVGGFDCFSPVRAVIAISNPQKPSGGGTGQAIRVAKQQGIPVFDLAFPEDLLSLTQAIQADGLFSAEYLPVHYRTNLRYSNGIELAQQAQKIISQEFPYFVTNFLGQGRSRWEEYNQWVASLPLPQRLRFEDQWEIVIAEKKLAPAGFSVWSQWIKKMQIQPVANPPPS